MSDLKTLTTVVHRMVAMDFDVGAVQVRDPSLAPLADALSGLSVTLKQETVASDHIEALFLATPTMLIQLNPLGQITAVNPAGQALLGAGVEGLLLSELLEELLADEGAAVPGIAEMAESARIVILDFSGSERHLDLTLAPLWGRLGELQGYVVSGVDVTADVNALQIMDAARQAALDDVVRRTRFLASISHEIRTPLNGIIGTLSLMKARGEDSPELSVLHSCADQLMGLIGDVLSFAKLDEGKLELSCEPLSLERLAEEVAAMLRPRLKPGVALQVDTSGLAVRAVRGDPVRVRQILLNLGSNAVRFTTAGKVCIRMTSAAGRDDVAVTLAVTDTGPGIAPEAQERIFEPYEQASLSHGGTGLGLPITRGLAAAMGGSVAVTSAVGAGSTFTATLRFLPPRPAPTAAPAAEVMPEPGMVVLIVDDNAINRFVLRQMLERLGCVVEDVSDGQLAVDRVCLSAAPLDLVLMDRQMPIMDGVVATRQIRAAGAHSLPIVALTASALEEERLECLDAGMNAFVTKPLRFESLRAMLLNLQAGREQSK